jgi:hypothetical protein
MNIGSVDPVEQAGEQNIFACKVELQCIQTNEDIVLFTRNYPITTKTMLVVEYFIVLLQIITHYLILFLEL